MDQFLFLLTIFAALCTMLLGGNFFAFSALFLRAVGGLTAERGIVAMQATVTAAKTQALLVLFFGTAVVCLVLGALSAFHWDDPFAPYALAGATVFLLGGFAVTMLGLVFGGHYTSLDWLFMSINLAKSRDYPQSAM